MPVLNAELILLVVAVILVALSLRDYVRERRFSIRQRTRLTVAAIFFVVVIFLRLAGS